MAEQTRGATSSAPITDVLKIDPHNKNITSLNSRMGNWMMKNSHIKGQIILSGKKCIYRFKKKKNHQIDNWLSVTSFVPACSPLWIALVTGFTVNSTT